MIEKIEGVEIRKSIYYDNEYMGYLDGDKTILVIPTNNLKYDNELLKFYKDCVYNIDNLLFQFEFMPSDLLLSVQVSNIISALKTLKLDTKVITDFIFKSLDYANIDLLENLNFVGMLTLDTYCENDYNYFDIGWWERCHKVYLTNKTINEIL